MTDDMLPDSQLALITQGYTADRDRLQQLTGQIHVAHAFAKLLTVSELAALAEIKNNKLYKNLGDQPVIAPNGEVLTVSTFADYCTYIGRSRQHVDLQLSELHTFGEETLAEMRRIGLGHRELRRISALPDADRDVVIQEVNLNVGDKEAIVGMIDDMASKHAAEKAALEKKLADALADGEAKDRINADKNDKLDELSTENHTLRTRSDPWPKRVKDIAAEITVQHGLALQAMSQLDTLRDAILNEPFDQPVADEAFEMLGCVYYDAVARLAEEVAPLIDACEAVFVGYYQNRVPAAALFEQLRDAHPDLFGDQEAGQ